MRPDLTRPEIRRGPVFDFGPRPPLDPLALREGIDVLRVVKPGGPLPVATLCVYWGFSSGRAVVGVNREGFALELVSVDPVLLDDLAPLIDLLHPDWMDFREGYEQGRMVSLDERPIGSRSKGRKPSWFGRGVVAGFSDSRRGVDRDWESDRRAFNRLLRTMPPEEWPAPMPWEARDVA